MSNAKRRLVNIFLALCFILTGILCFHFLKASKPPIEIIKPSVPIPGVRTIAVKTMEQAIHIEGKGTVTPLREINLLPQVIGKVVYISSQFVNGGQFKKGDTLLRIDPIDYKLTVALAQAKVKDAESKLKLLKEEATLAREEWHLHPSGGQKTDASPPPLVAKEPQLAAVQAALEAAQADLKKAELSLSRTELKAPFNGRVSQKNVDIGQYVAPGASLGIIYSIDAVEIVLPLEDQDLFWFHVPGFTPGEEPGSPAAIQAKIAGYEQTWNGRVVRAQGKLDTRSRMINIVVRVDQPYAQKPPLAVGLFVTVDITGRTLDKGTRIPRTALRQGSLVWLMNKDGQLKFQKVKAARIQGEQVVIESGLKDGDQVIISSLKVVTDGMAIQRLPDNR